MSFPEIEGQEAWPSKSSRAWLPFRDPFDVRLSQATGQDRKRMMSADEALVKTDSGYHT